MLSSKSNNNALGITLGDPGGIGPEIVAKSLRSPALKTQQFVIIGDGVLFDKYRLKETARHSLVDCGNFSRLAQIQKGPTHANGAAALSYLQKAISLIKTKRLNALVTAPVSKEAIAKSVKNFTGHTEFLARQFKAKSVEMMFAHKNLRIVIATRHIPLKDVPSVLSKQRLKECILCTQHALQKNFKIRAPRIAVCGLNPHAGEAGLIGKEDRLVIRPVIVSLGKKGFDLSGPIAADTLFVEENRKPYDCLIAMYHDQGLIPAKTLFFDKLVNVTLGLPFVRTSPDHGTAYDIAGKNRARASSMTEAIKLALELS